MFGQLNAFYQRPEPFSRYTADILWTEPHISQSMLNFHLNPQVDAASRRPKVIESIVEWMDQHLSYSGKVVCDLGCGPGLYAEKMARRGASVTGVDFSSNSLDHARKSADQAHLKIDYIQADYLKDDLPRDQDIISLIYGDLCALSAQKRHLLYNKIKGALKPGGCFVCDVFSIGQYEQRQPAAIFSKDLMDGFWAADDYFGFCNTCLYEAEKLVLDHYLIVEATRKFEIFNWLQYFDIETIAAELEQAGFKSIDMVDALTGKPWVATPREFGVIAHI